VSAARDGSERLRKFLLGDLSEAEREAIERQCLAEHSLIFEQLVALEDELRFDYLLGRLSPADHARFERRYLTTTEGKERLAFAQALLLAADAAPVSAPARAPIAWRRHLIAAGLAVAVAGLGVVVTMQARTLEQFRRQVAQAQAEIASRQTELAGAEAGAENTQAGLVNAQAEAARLRDELARAQSHSLELEQQIAAATHPQPQPRAKPDPPPAPDAPLPELTLRPGLLISSGQELAKVDATAAARGVTLTLTLPSGGAAYPSYSAAVLNADGRPFWTQAHLTRVGKAVPFIVPAGRLKKSDYQVLLRGVLADGRPQDLAGYSFRVFAR